MRQRLHPGVVFLYFLVILVTGAFSGHPVLQVSALVGGLLYCGLILPGKEFGKMFLTYLIPALLLALTNPFFSREGATPLFYVNQSPVTLESLLYGVSLGSTMFTVLCWFRILNTVMTGDRLLSLFSGALPKLSLLLTVTVRTVPRLRKRLRETRDVQQAMGVYQPEQGYVHRLRCELHIFRAVLSAAAEEAIETGDSMRARGYGRPGRTGYRTHHFTWTDGLALTLLLCLTAVIDGGIAWGKLAISFYPTLSFALNDPWIWLCGACFALLCLLPSILELSERIRWKWLLSRI